MAGPAGKEPLQLSLQTRIRKQCSRSLGLGMAEALPPLPRSLLGAAFHAAA